MDFDPRDQGRSGVAERGGDAHAEAQPAAAAAFTVTASSLNVRSAPDASSRRLGGLAHGARITGTPDGSGWIRITFEGQPAFISAEHVAAAAAEPQPPPPGGACRRSGAEWVEIADESGWSNRTDFAALDPSWGPRAEAFVEGLRAAGAEVRVTGGRRHPTRAALMHYAWGVAHGQYLPAQANEVCRGRGIYIEWDHGTVAASRAAAQALVEAFELVHQAALTSNHIRGLAVDMEISNLPASIAMNGKTYATERGASGEAAARSVAPIGRALGVIWFGSGDIVHWSHDGH